MRTVDADRLKKSFEANTPIAFQDCVPGIHSIIDLEPTVEAEPVRHGHWIDEGLYADNFPHHAWRCSKCGWHELEIEEPYGNYCRNCGAKMDEVRHETRIKSI